MLREARPARPGSPFKAAGRHTAPAELSPPPHPPCNLRPAEAGGGTLEPFSETPLPIFRYPRTWNFTFHVFQHGCTQLHVCLCSAHLSNLFYSSSSSVSDTFPSHVHKGLTEYTLSWKLCLVHTLPVQSWSDTSKVGCHVDEPLLIPCLST